MFPWSYLEAKRNFKKDLLWRLSPYWFWKISKRLGRCLDIVRTFNCNLSVILHVLTWVCVYNYLVTDKPNPTIKSSSKAFPHVEAATHKPSDNSRFVCTIRPYCLTYGYLCLPKQFTLRNGLMSKKCDLIIRDEWQRSWNLILRPFGTSVCIRGGWDRFRDTYCLKEGDRIMFEVVTDGEKPVWKFHGKTSGRCRHHWTMKQLVMEGTLKQLNKISVWFNYMVHNLNKACYVFFHKTPCK